MLRHHDENRQRHELFLIYNEIVSAEAGSEEPAHTTAMQLAFTIDQSHNIEGKIGPMILSVLNCQEAYARALCVPQVKLAVLQAAGEVLAAHNLLTDTFRTDVRPLLRQVRQEMGVPSDPMAAFRASIYETMIAAERGTYATSSGYQ